MSYNKIEDEAERQTQQLVEAFKKENPRAQRYVRVCARKIPPFALSTTKMTS